MEIVFVCTSCDVRESVYIDQSLVFEFDLYGYEHVNTVCSECKVKGWK